MSANDRQHGGTHYKRKDGGEEHWDRVWRLGLDYFQAAITKYVERHKLKNGIEDLLKARHYLDKYIELLTTKEQPCNQPNTNCSPPVPSATKEEPPSDTQTMVTPQARTE